MSKYKKTHLHKFGFLKSYMNPLLADNCLHLVDIGASGGIHPRWRQITPNFQAILFEPDFREYESLLSTAPNNYVVLNTALSEYVGEIDFHLYSKQEVSSVYLPDMAFLDKFPDVERFQLIKKIKLRVDTLDNQLENHNLRDIDFIKIDTQGHELPILKGAIKTLNNVIGLELEVEFSPIYNNQPLFSELNTFVVSLGFELFDLRRYFWKRKHTRNYREGKGQIVFGDALYFRSPENILSKQDITAKKIIRCILVYLAYGYLDIAEILCRLAKKTNIFSEEVEREVQLFLKKYGRKAFLPDFRGKGRIYNLLIKLANLFSSNKWYSGDDKLGNR